MRSLQKNMCDNEAGHVLYETMFVWNEFLTRGIRNLLQNTVWTVALVYGFFKQVRLCFACLLKCCIENLLDSEVNAIFNL